MGGQACPMLNDIDLAYRRAGLAPTAYTEAHFCCAYRAGQKSEATTFEGSHLFISSEHPKQFQ